MEKIIKVGNYEIPAKSTAASLMSYKSNFGRDGLHDIVALSSVGADNLTDLDTDVFLRFLWVFAKAANKAIPPLMEWLEGFDVSPIDFIIEALPQLMDLLGQTMNITVSPKN